MVPRDPSRRTLQQQVVQQVTVIAALFGGFSYSNLCLMPQGPEADFFAQLNVALAGIATCLLVGSAFLGGIFALLANALDMEEMLERERWIFAPWGAMVSAGVVTFFVDVGMIATRTAPWVGALVAMAALAVVFFTLYACGRLLDLGARSRVAEEPLKESAPAESPQDAPWQGAAPTRIGGGILGGGATPPRRILRSSEAARDSFTGSMLSSPEPAAEAGTSA